MLVIQCQYVTDLNLIDVKNSLSTFLRWCKCNIMHVKNSLIVSLRDPIFFCKCVCFSVH